MGLDDPIAPTMDLCLYDGSVPVYIEASAIHILMQHRTLISIFNNKKENSYSLYGFFLVKKNK